MKMETIPRRKCTNIINSWEEKSRLGKPLSQQTSFGKTALSLRAKEIFEESSSTSSLSSCFAAPAISFSLYPFRVKCSEPGILSTSASAIKSKRSNLRTMMLSSLELPKKSLRLIIPNRLRVVKLIISDHFNACVRKMI